MNSFSTYRWDRSSCTGICRSECTPRHCCRGSGYRGGRCGHNSSRSSLGRSYTWNTRVYDFLQTLTMRQALDVSDDGTGAGNSIRRSFPQTWSGLSANFGRPQRQMIPARDDQRSNNQRVHCAQIVM